MPDNRQLRVRANRGASPTCRRLFADFFNVPTLEKEQVLAAFAAHKAEVTEGSLSTAH